MTQTLFISLEGSSCQYSMVFSNSVLIECVKKHDNANWWSLPKICTFCKLYRKITRCKQSSTVLHMQNQSQLNHKTNQHIKLAQWTGKHIWPMCAISNVCIYYSMNSCDAHIWSESHCYLSSVHSNPAIYVGCQDSSEILQGATQPQFFLLQKPFCWQFVE